MNVIYGLNDKKYIKMHKSILKLKKIKPCSFIISMFN